jgi:hypothetical protein
MKQILALLIPHYEDTLARILADEGKSITDILFETNTAFGICKCAEDKFNTIIRDESWIKGNCEHNTQYWYNTPIKESLETVVKLFELRINKMKILLNL